MRYLILVLLLPFYAGAQTYSVKSPDGKMVCEVKRSNEGLLTYQLLRNGEPLVNPSRLGMVLKDIPKSFDQGLVITGSGTAAKNESWQPVWGEERSIVDHYQELSINVKQPAADDMEMIIRFRMYNEGLGFRYEWPAQGRLNHFVVMQELTEVNFPANHTAWWIPGDYDTNEYFYTKSRLSEVDATAGSVINEISTKSIFSENGVQTPLMLKTDKGLYLNLHEAALTNFPVLQWDVSADGTSLDAHLVPDVFGNKAFLQTPAVSPWRVLNVSEKATDMLASRLILNLNEPSKVENPSFIKPTKYVGIWWEMHVGKSTWDYAGTQDGTYDKEKLKPSGRHGATTTRTKEYIDFAAAHGFDGVLIEGWNTGWEDWFGKWKEDVFDFVTPYPDFDLKELSRYAREKRVSLIMHHETSGSVTNYERWMDTAYRLMKNYGYPAVKTGYVGNIIPRGEHHDGQWMTRHFNRVAEKTAAYGLMVNMHESHRPTGLHRTWPNWIACEAARGNEFNAWSRGNPPEHETILPFTRLMGGPMDYTPGIFEIKMDYYKPGAKEQVHTTLAKQLALYVTLYSPLQMAADLPENYQARMDAFQFIKDVAIDWDNSYYLEAEPGDYLTIARKARDRQAWFVGAITDENPRTATIDLSFLPKGKYQAVVYSDAENAHWEKAPMAYKVERKTVANGDVLKVNLAAGGGCAISIVPL